MYICVGHLYVVYYMKPSTSIHTHWTLEGKSATLIIPWPLTLSPSALTSDPACSPDAAPPVMRGNYRLPWWRYDRTGVLREFVRLSNDISIKWLRFFTLDFVMVLQHNKNQFEAPVLTFLMYVYWVTMETVTVVATGGKLVPCHIRLGTVLLDI